MSAQNLANTSAPSDEKSRPLDPNVLQRRAAAPDTSVWVSASAGTGKTKVLTDRVLRLLLPQIDSAGNIAPGTPAYKILCLTFTKAAASEMALRISKTLARWTTMPLDGDKKSLTAELKDLLGRTPQEPEIKAARKLFADVIDVPGGLKIMTIHSFCGSVLGRFPLEAGINPNFKQIEDFEAAKFMKAAREKTLARATADIGSPLNRALHTIAQTINEDQFTTLLGAIARERRQFEKLLSDNFGSDGLYAKICETLGIASNLTPENYLLEACTDAAFARDDVLRIAKLMNEIGTKKDKERSDHILNWLALNIKERSRAFEIYKKGFLTDKNKIFADPAYKKVCETAPDALDILNIEAERLVKLIDTLSAIKIAAYTRDLLILGDAILKTYKAEKDAQAALDFDDLILKTLDLLRGDTMKLDTIKLDTVQAGSWVHFKLDQGLDHILIDEAQDTNPEQWQIIEALCNEFYLASPDRQTQRTVFTVGDEKQSIYSFQRASPDEFSRMQNAFAERTNSAAQKWDSVPMDISFRSTKSVLAAVDAVFASANAAKGMGTREVSHSAFRRGQAGLVELWPLFESDETPDLDLWKPLKESTNDKSGAKKLAEHLAGTVKNWLDNDEILESQNRKIQPKDIMILVRTRGTLIRQISRELKNQNIPVSGLDRIILKDELAAEDLIAAAKFTLQPRDDLNLACLLKSPLIGISEDTLMELAAYRQHGETLYERTQNTPEIKTYLEALQKFARQKTPFEFFTSVLQSPCPNDDKSGLRAFIKRLGHDAGDTIDEMLSMACDFEHQNIASLQNFVTFMNSSQSELKRENNAEHNEVRIMTIHGSKGLQAPIVILPDTTTRPSDSGNKPDKRLLWPNQSDMPVPLWSPRKDTDNAAYTAAMNILDERLEEEYRRLLYVAMTRAEDRLYVAGALNKRQSADKLNENCWYNLVKTGLKSMPDIETLDNGYLRLYNPQTQDAKTKDSKEKQQSKQTPLPDWAFETPKEETADNKIYRPSQIADTALSPLETANENRFARGNLIHKLLQFLPEIEPEQRENAAQKFISLHGSRFTPNEQSEILEKTLKVLTDANFADIFTPGSIAEAPISGYLEGIGRISGQIDRLNITTNTVYIIDYKTNRPPPRDLKNVPEIYKTQMQTYANVLAQIYPGRKIKAALLWTDVPFLMELDLD